ncbi:hypothetical protein C8J55DRAFT_556584 [Lentinula edodes]|uniref:Uncharacterized protein n=1 Tax=Lentinula lateritia TaxID=40482 RepID=A0A9W9AYF9_9AGAR|nr:hypothetical protein C8J55DRAFT_556584 [Lentinula edodes]
MPLESSVPLPYLPPVVGFSVASPLLLFMPSEGLDPIEPGTSSVSVDKIFPHPHTTRNMAGPSNHYGGGLYAAPSYGNNNNLPPTSSIATYVIII